MKENVLILEPVVRWSSTANIILSVKLYSIELTIQVRLTSLCMQYQNRESLVPDGILKF